MKTKRIVKKVKSIYPTSRLIRVIEARAKREGRSFSSLVVHILEQALSHGAR